MPRQNGHTSVVYAHCARVGCENRVKARRCRWCSQACVPREVRQENCRKSRATYAYRVRRQKFTEEMQRLRALGQTFTQEDLVATFQRIYRRAYNAGFNASRNKSVAA